MTTRSTEAKHTAAYPKDRALALALMRLAQIESHAEMPAANARQHAKIALDEIAGLAPILALNVEDLRDHYRTTPPAPSGRKETR